MQAPHSTFHPHELHRSAPVAGFHSHARRSSARQVLNIPLGASPRADILLPPQATCPETDRVYLPFRDRQTVHSPRRIALEPMHAVIQRQCRNITARNCGDLDENPRVRTQLHLPKLTQATPKCPHADSYTVTQATDGKGKVSSPWTHTTDIRRDDTRTRGHLPS